MKHNRPLIAFAFLCLACLMFSAGRVQGQWLTESYALSNGWTAVYLRQTPWPVLLDEQMAGLPVRSVHRYSRRQSLTQFTENPTAILARGSEWVVWYPESSSNRLVTTLWSLTGDNVYLFECETACVWTVKGIPVVPERDWIANDWNLMGLPIQPASGVVFAAYFSGAENIDVQPSPVGGKVARTLPSGTIQDITSQTARWLINPKEGYWIKTQGDSTYAGTIRADTLMGGLHFPDNNNIRSFTIWNERGTNQWVSLRLVSSEAPPVGAPTREGEVPLLYPYIAPTSGVFEWHAMDLNTRMTNWMADGEQWVITLGLDRSAMNPPANTNASWQSILEVTDQGGTLIRIPVSARYGENGDYDALWPSGLWVGEVALNKVDQALNGASVGPLPSNGELVMRVILHVDLNGQCRLLQQAVLEWTTQVQDGETNGYYRIRTRQASASNPKNCSRVSSVAFPFEMNIPLSGSFQTGMSGSYSVSYNSPENPFKHVYNPHHDNIGSSGELLPEGEENYSITNQVSMIFEPVSAMGSSAGLWNPVEEMRGTYTQTLRGLRREAIRAEGTITLQRVCRTGVLE